jgi:hypothetical protein
MALDPVPGSPPTVPPIPPDIVPPVKEPEPDRLPGEEPVPNPDENDRPVKWIGPARQSLCTKRIGGTPGPESTGRRHFSPCARPPIRLHARHLTGRPLADPDCGGD